MSKVTVFTTINNYETFRFEDENDYTTVRVRDLTDNPYNNP